MRRTDQSVGSLRYSGRVCLYMAGNPVNEPGMYVRAKEFAAKVIDTGFHALNPSYQQVFINYIQDKYDIRESIFEVEFYGNNVGTYTTTAGQVGRNNGIKFTNTDKPEIGYSIGSIRATPYFFQLFEDDDERRDWSLPITSSRTRVRKRRYRATICGYASAANSAASMNSSHRRARPIHRRISPFCVIPTCC